MLFFDVVAVAVRFREKEALNAIITVLKRKKIKTWKITLKFYFCVSIYKFAQNSDSWKIKTIGGKYANLLVFDFKNS